MGKEDIDGKESANRATNSHAKLEQGSSNESLGEKEAPRFNSPVRVTFHHYRKRLIDHDNLCTKGALDQVVRLGILPDDSAKWVKEVSHRQFKSSKEETHILIEEID